MPRFEKNSESLNFSSKLTFDNKEQYDLFMLYLGQTKINDMRDEPSDNRQSLADFYLQNSDQAQLEVILQNKWGNESVVSKFMEVTRMMEMDYRQYMISGYEPDTNPSYLPLARQGNATIDDNVLQRMQQYRQNFSTKKTKPIIEETAEEMEKTIKQTLSQYEGHLRQKLLNDGILDNIESKVNINKIRQDTLTTKQRKLLNRYAAISRIYNDIKDKPSLDERDYSAVKTAVNTCQNNKPTWSERSFLQKFTDLLSLGLKPLYRLFFSKEKQFEEELQEKSFPAPK